ncbi:MAG: SDR family oxidoreductase [Candidatus Sumerlaeia bacterium]
MSSERFFDLTGRVAIVTGSSRGLGSYMAKSLARAGADIVVTSRDAASLKEVCDEISAMGRQAMPLELDVMKLDSIERGIDAVMERFGRIDILLNNAGCNRRKKAIDMTLDDWETVVGTDLRGQFFMSTTVAKKAMIPAGYGRVILLGSVTSYFGYGLIAPYCAARGGIKMLAASLADEWGTLGITVNCIAPGWFHTHQTDRLFKNDAWREYLIDRTPLKRVGGPDDLGGAAVFLASEESRFVTGQTLAVDGGFTTGAVKLSID